MLRWAIPIIRTRMIGHFLVGVYICKEVKMYESRLYIRWTFNRIPEASSMWQIYKTIASK